MSDSSDGLAQNNIHVGDFYDLVNIFMMIDAVAFHTNASLGRIDLLVPLA